MRVQAQVSPKKALGDLSAVVPSPHNRRLPCKLARRFSIESKSPGTGCVTQEGLALLIRIGDCLCLHPSIALNLRFSKISNRLLALSVRVADQTRIQV